MAERPIFIPTSEEDGYVRRIDFEIPWAGGFAEVQKKKNIRSLHDAAKAAGYDLSWRFRPNPTRWRDVT